MKNKLKNLLLLLFITSIIPINNIWTQQFVDPTNEWFIKDICYSSGNWYIDVFSYQFSEQEIQTGGLMYRELITDNPSPNGIHGAGKYYREEDGKVYLLPDLGFEEYLIYDYNLELNDELTFPPLWGDQFTLKVLSIDTIALNSGELRKRVELGVLPNLTLTATWIEGIGSFNSPMNTFNMFQLDCWVELDCYWKNQELNYQIGACELGNFDDIIDSNKEIEVFKEVIVHPNPSGDIINLINLNEVQIQEIEIYNINGELIKRLPTLSSKKINVSTLDSGFYILSIKFNDETNKIMKFIKK